MRFYRNPQRLLLTAVVAMIVGCFLLILHNSMAGDVARHFLFAAGIGALIVALIASALSIISRKR